MSISGTTAIEFVSRIINVISESWRACVYSNWNAEQQQQLTALKPIPQAGKFAEVKRAS
jgi:hypothetical protein